MSTIHKSYREIGAFDREARGWLARREAEFQSKWRAEKPDERKDQKPPAAPGTKLTYAIARMLKRSQTILQRYQEKISDLEIEHASEDKDGNLAWDERGNLKFKKEALLEKNKKQRELFDGKTEIEPYYATELPKDLSEEEREIFVDFVIKDEAKPKK